MAGSLRVGVSRGGTGRGLPSTPPTYSGAMSGYGLSRAESVGYNPRNALAYQATQAAKAYGTSDKGDTVSKAKGYTNE